MLFLTRRRSIRRRTAREIPTRGSYGLPLEIKRLIVITPGLTGGERNDNYLRNRAEGTCTFATSIRLSADPFLPAWFRVCHGRSDLHATRPDQPLEAIIRAGRDLRLEVRYRDRTIARTPPLGLDVDGLLRADALPAVTDSARRHVDTTIRPPVPEKRAVIADRYNELRLSMGPSLAVTFRAYDDGVAYRFETAFPGTITVLFESAGLNLADTDFVRIALTDCGIDADCFHSSFEQTYARFPVCDVPSGHLAFLPVLVETQGVHLVFTESDLWDYPGLWLRGVQGEPALTADFARYPVEERVVGTEFKKLMVAKRADFIARTEGTRTLPWRVLMVAPEAASLVENDLVYRLARPLALDDVSWIRPGKSTEEWITSRLLYNVDFVSGLNTETYRYYIDFAAEYGLQYIMFDAGWSDNDDNTKLNPDIDVPGLIAYARSKNVGVILWNEALALDRNLDEALERYAAWGASGIMCDFMERDDQKMVRFYERVARAAAERHLVVNLHGAFKPTGMQRAFPNLLTREGVLGHEWNMWSERVTPDHALTVPFVRMAGTHGLGRRLDEQRHAEDLPCRLRAADEPGYAHAAAAQYVIYESPLQYLAGTPSDYRAAPDFTRELAAVPTT